MSGWVKDDFKLAVAVGLARDYFGNFAESLFVALALDVEHQTFCRHDSEIDQRQDTFVRAEFFTGRDADCAIGLFGDLDDVRTLSESKHALCNHDEGNFRLRLNFGGG